MVAVFSRKEASMATYDGDRYGGPEVRVFEKVRASFCPVRDAPTGTSHESRVTSHESRPATPHQLRLLVVPHLLDLLDEGPDLREEGPELRAAPKTMHVLAGRGPVNAQHVRARILL